MRDNLEIHSIKLKKPIIYPNLILEERGLSVLKPALPIVNGNVREGGDIRLKL